MNWDEDGFSLYQKAYRPRPQEIIGPGRRFRDLDEHEEIEHRVAMYAVQVEQRGRITHWMPSRGSGKSA